MSYSPETEALIAALMRGEDCPTCGGVGRCFDDCPEHPENMGLGGG